MPKVMLHAIAVVVGVLVMTGAVAAELSSALVSPYLQVQMALANDTTDGVSEAARTLVTEAEKLGEEGRAIVAAAREMADAADLTTARKAFEPLSMAFIEYGDAMGLGELRVAYCPMVDKSWVQADGSIRNPYYGAFMLNCGEFR